LERKQKEQKAVDINLNTFVENDFSPLSNGDMSLRYDATHNDGANYNVVRRSWKNNPIKVFLSVMSFDVWEIVVKFVNRVMIEKITTKAIGKARFKYHKPIDITTILNWYGISILLENDYSGAANSLEYNFRQLKKEEGFEMGINKYLAILGCLIPNNQEMEQMFSSLREDFQKNYIPGTDVANDECCYAYFVSKEKRKKYELANDPVPQYYIPRKKHPNCLLTYMLASKSAQTGLPYVLDIEPSIKFPFVTPRETTTKFLDRWCYEHKPHLVCDAAFGGMDPMQDIENRGTFVTYSMNVREIPFVWELLKRKTEIHKWNAAVTGQNFLASVKLELGDNNKLKYHHLLTNAYKCNSRQTDTDENKSTTYTRQYLEGKEITKEKLKDILKNNNSRTTGKKSVLIDRILKTCNKSTDKLDKLLEDIETNNFTVNPIHHKFYVDNFNSIDLHSRYWYRFYWNYRAKNWRCKYILSILTSGTVNSWTVYNELVRINIYNYREILVRQLINFKNE
jgi:hypothetical protein